MEAMRQIMTPVAFLSILHCLVGVSQSAPSRCTSTSPPPRDQLDIILAQKLSSYGDDKNSIPDFDVTKLTEDPQTSHLPCPRDHNDPQRWTSPAVNIYNIIPWVYKEYMSTDHLRPIYPHIRDAEQCKPRIFRCPSGYEVFTQEEYTYHLEQQTTCTENPHQYDMKLVKVKTVTFYSCKQKIPYPAPAGAPPPVEDH